MLLVNLNDIRGGMVVGATLPHPRQPEVTLLARGVTIDAGMIAHLRELGVDQLWVHHDAVADLDAMMDPNLPAARRAVYTKIKEDFGDMAQATITYAQVAQYRQAIMDLVCRIIGGKKVASLAEQLFSADAGLFSHGANVAYLAILAGLELDAYIVMQRQKLGHAHARDLTSLGLGAMLHDIGKVTLDARQRERHEVDGQAEDAGEAADYRRHTITGYKMLQAARAPASATQAVLNHHQRFDGQGWPDMAGVTRNRSKGTLSGRNIHVFCRIVAAANALDNLLRDAGGARRPAVAALSDLAGPRFNGWFDPVVRQSMVRRLPPFPIGSHVILSDGRQAAVVSPNFHQPCRPVVRLLAESTRLADGQYPNLSLEQRPEVHIKVHAGVDVERWLFNVNGRPRAA